MSSTKIFGHASCGHVRPASGRPVAAASKGATRPSSGAKKSRKIAKKSRKIVKSRTAHECSRIARARSARARSRIATHTGAHVASRPPRPLTMFRTRAWSARCKRGALGEPRCAPCAHTQRAGLGWAHTPKYLVYLYTPDGVSRAQLRKIYCRRAESCAFTCVGHSTRAHCGATFELKRRGLCHQLAPTCRSGHPSWAGPERRSTTLLFMHFT